MDMIDVAQRRQQEEIDHALAARAAPGVGTASCSRFDCDELIADCRRHLGATLCLDCQQRAEREAQQCARRGV